MLTFDHLQEGPMADHYTDPAVRARIRADYQSRWAARVTPFTNPELFDPCAPPEGYSYDPYYEIWIKND